MCGYVLLRYHLSIYVKLRIDLFIIVSKSLHKNIKQDKIVKINVEKYFKNINLKIIKS